MRKLIALILCLVLAIGVCGSAVTAEENLFKTLLGSETMRIGVLTMLKMPEEEMEAFSRAQNLADYLLNLYGYSENVVYAFFPEELTKGVGDGERLSENTGALSKEIIYYDRLDEMQMALNANLIDMIQLYSTTARYLCAQNDNLVCSAAPTVTDDADKWVMFIATTLKTNDFAFMMLEGKEALRDEFNTAIAAMKEDGTMDRLIQEQIEDLISGAEIAPIELPVIDGAETVRVAVTGALPPMDYVAADGTPAGFNTAVLAEISRRINRNIEMVFVDSMSGRSAALASGTVDAVFWTRTNRRSNLYGDRDEEKQQQTFDKLPEELKPIAKVIMSYVNVSNIGRADMPDGTIITEPYFTDWIVTVMARDRYMQLRQIATDFLNAADPDAK